MTSIAHKSDKHVHLPLQNNVFSLYAGTTKELSVLCQKALSYAIEYGYSVFPVTDTKKPLKGFKWSEKSSSNPLDIIEMEWDKASNVAIHCEKSSLLVIDIDVKSGVNGFTDLRKLEALYPDLLDAPRVSTPSGGEHIYLKLEGSHEITVKGLKGIDLKHKGYVLAPGSHVRYDNGHEGTYKLRYGSLEEVPNVSKEFLEDYSRQLEDYKPLSKDAQIGTREILHFLPDSILKRYGYFPSKNHSIAVFSFFCTLGKLGICNEEEAIAFFEDRSNPLEIVKQYHRNCITKKNRNTKWLRGQWRAAQVEVKNHKPEVMRPLWLAARSGNGQIVSRNLKKPITTSEARLLKALIVLEVKSRTSKDKAPPSFKASYRQIVELSGLALDKIKGLAESLEAKEVLFKPRAISREATSEWVLNKDVFICKHYVQTELKGFDFLGLPFRLGKLDACIFQEVYLRLSKSNYRSQAELVRDVLETLPEIHEKKVKRELVKLRDLGLIELTRGNVSLADRYRAIGDVLEALEEVPEFKEAQRAIKTRHRLDRELFSQVIEARLCSNQAIEAASTAKASGYEHLLDLSREYSLEHLASS
jgi:hypothetical protein